MIGACRQCAVQRHHFLKDFKKFIYKAVVTLLVVFGIGTVCIASGLFSFVSGILYFKNRFSQILNVAYYTDRLNCSFKIILYQQKFSTNKSIWFQ